MASTAQDGTLLAIWSAAVAQRNAATATLETFRGRAEASAADLAAALQRHDAARQRRAALRRAAGRAARALAAVNGQIGRLHQEVVALSGRAGALDRALARASEPAARLQLRRSRAAVGLEIEDRQKELTRLRDYAGQARGERQAAQADAQDTLLEEREAGRDLDALRDRLPPPRLYFSLFAGALAVAHCDLLLAPDPAAAAPAWGLGVRTATLPVIEVHAALNAGRTRVDRHDELTGGRAPETGEALYALVAAGDELGARDLFAAACPPALCFHHIMAVFRCWCLGAYLAGDHQSLAEMVAMHGYAGGVRAAYAHAFAALLADDAQALTAALTRLIAAEVRAGARTAARGLTLVNSAALAICRLAAARGLAVPSLGPTVPDALRTR